MESLIKKVGNDNRGLSRNKAHIIETKPAQERGCKSAPGGDDPDDPFVSWSVYYFEYE